MLERLISPKSSNARFITLEKAAIGLRMTLPLKNIMEKPGLTSAMPVGDSTSITIAALNVALRPIQKFLVSWPKLKVHSLATNNSYNIDLRNGHPLLRIVLIFKENGAPGRRRYQASREIILVPAQEVDTWGAEECCIAQPEEARLPINIIEWPQLAPKSSLNMGYRVRAIGATNWVSGAEDFDVVLQKNPLQRLSDARFWLLESDGQPRIFAWIMKVSFSIFVDIKNVPLDSTLKALMDNWILDKKTQSFDLRNLPDRDGPVYERWFPVDGKLSMIFILLRKNGNFQTMINVQKRLLVHN